MFTTYGCVTYACVSYPCVMPDQNVTTQNDRDLGSAAREVADDVGSAASTVIEAIKPRLRGWLHFGMGPLALAAAIVLVALAPTSAGRWAGAVFGASAVLLFGTSAAYHRGTWSPRAAVLLKRLDHSNIFLIIAGSYTPFAVMLLEGSQRVTLLVLVWSGALLGVAFRVFWVGAPRWLYTPVYVVLGWVAVFYLPPFLTNGGPGVLTLIIVGGGLYTLGAVVYGTKWPNPSPRWFGFHEVFHAFTVAAFVSHYIAASLAIYGATPAGV